MDKGEAISKVSEYKRILKKYLPIESVYLFGSYAKGTNRKDSDIDVAIVCNRVDLDFFAINPLLWKLRREVDDRIEPILIEKDFDDANFLGEIKKYGIEVV
jgi:predicted nucleotidyltransferase